MYTDSQAFRAGCDSRPAVKARERFDADSGEIPGPTVQSGWKKSFGRSARVVCLFGRLRAGGIVCIVRVGGLRPVFERSVSTP